MAMSHLHLASQERLPGRSLRQSFFQANTPNTYWENLASTLPKSTPSSLVVTHNKHLPLAKFSRMPNICGKIMQSSLDFHQMQERNWISSQLKRTPAKVSKNKLGLSNNALCRYLHDSEFDGCSVSDLYVDLISLAFVVAAVFEIAAT